MCGGVQQRVSAVLHLGLGQERQALGGSEGLQFDRGRLHPSPELPQCWVLLTPRLGVRMWRKPQCWVLLDRRLGVLGVRP